MTVEQELLPRFYTDDDPTHGYVQYVDANTAQASGFARAVNNSQVYLGVDNSTVLNVSSSATTGRRSVRLESLHTFDQGILITDFAHVPSGVCGAWPAYWTYDYAENPYGEVDIIEGVNDQVGDDISLHTSAQCQLTDDSTSQSGTDVRTDCSLKTNYVDGCGVSGPSNSYGDPFNGQGGGVWALFLRQDELAIWMFPRNGIPDEISSGGQLTLDKWGVPLLHFASSSGCRVSEQWKNQTIVSSPSQGLKFTNSPPGLLHEQIFNIDFCGENAGGTNWNESSTSASQSCADSTGFPTCAATPRHLLLAAAIASARLPAPAQPRCRAAYIADSTSADHSSRSSSPIITPAESSAATVPIDTSLKRDILKSMVQVAVRQTRSYQSSFAGTYQASAFLVNQDFGLFFTAAHAVQGPCEGYIISHNDERCPPQKLETLDLVCLTLSPECAIVGSHVYLIGNDSGEKVNILRGTISRLDTTSPISFDSNVELIQASAAGKGGCSGGPLLTLDGEAIGICLGLSRTDQAEIDTDKNGLLVASIIIPETEANNFLKVNDILLSINEKPMVDFSELEEVFNSTVGEKVQVGVVRFGKKLSFDLTVHDLSAITPTQILSDSGATLHDVPYRTAVCWNVPLRGMYVASSSLNFSLGGHASGYIISSINNISTPNVVEGEKALSKIQDRERVAVRYTLASRNTRVQTTQITIDRHWNQMTLTHFNPKSEEWEYSRVHTIQSGSLDIKNSDTTDIESKLPEAHWISELKRRFVQVTWIAPALCLDENPETRLEGFGFIIYNGLLLVAKTTCPHDLCDIYIDIDGREVFGQVLHIDCRQNWVLIQYDAANTSTMSLNTVDLATGPPQELDTVTFVGMDDDNNFHSAKTAITGSFIADFLSSVQHAEAIDVLQIDSDIARMCFSGVIVNESHQIAGFWLIMRNDVRYVLPTTGIASVVRKILAGGVPKPRKTFNFRLEVIPPKDARVMGVDDEYIGYGVRVNGAQHRFFGVKRTTREVGEYIRHGDIFLSINGKIVNKFLDFDALDNTEAETAELLVVRDGNQIIVDFPLKIATDVTTDRVSSIFGMVFQRPYTSIKYINQDFPSDLIITCSAPGSPGQQSSMPYDNFITGVNGITVHDRNSFLDAVNQVPDETDFTIQSEDWNGKVYNDIVRKSSRAFGPYEFVKEGGKWNKVRLQLDGWKADLPITLQQK
ncbi:hypothetical protein UA08_03175 [Talaromyces atroroseus]|uniref:PDZ-like domain-containing protein n=1 Tax=Talaromyces atroroseus TaxID=1441469 RepID=A0A225AMW6_TALAT|nr:hypothetical protein UA08_03175 [Talaromyces atroroseus]OKL60793.1 hypothetical protein UA08_03175 [Talaromyces atroroseus]